MQTTASTGRWFDLVVVGASAGGLQATRTLLGRLPARFPLPVVLVLHRPPVRDGALVETLGRNLHLRVKEADDQEYMQSGVVYLAPANYHVLIEQDRSFSLSVDPPVFFCRPAIDVLFESAAAAVAGVVGCILSGANEDGVQGAAEIRKRGGTVLVQDPATAAAAEMPAAVIAAGYADRIMSLEDMAALLSELPCRPPAGHKTTR